MTTSVLICIAHGSEEIEFTITADLLVRAGINVTLASVTEDGSLTISASRGLKLLPIFR